MPSVPVYGPRKVAPKPLPNARLQAEETFESSGGPIGEAQAKFGLEIARTTGPVMQLLEQQRERADQIANQTTLKQFNDLDQQALTDPEHGILTKQNLTVMEERAGTIARWDEQSGMIAANLKTDKQRIFYEQQRLTRRDQLITQINRHQVAETRRADDTSTTAVIASNQERIPTVAHIPHLVVSTIDDTAKVIHAYADRNDLGPDREAQLITEASNKMWAAAITQNIATRRTALAQGEYQWARETGQLTGTALQQMTDAVKRGVLDTTAESSAASLMEQYGPKTDQDTIEIDKLAEHARAMHPDDVDLQKATINAIVSRVQLIETGRDRRMNKANTTLWGAVLNNVPYETIRTNPIAVDHPEVMLKIRDYYDSALYRMEQRAATREGWEASRESRLAARESRLWTAEQRREQQLEIDGWARYNDLRDIDTLRALDEGKILAELPNIGRENTKRLLQDWKTNTKNDLALAQADADQDVFYERGEANGIAYIRSPKTNPQKATVGRIRADIDLAIARESVVRKRPLLPAEQREIMDARFGQMVMYSNYGFFDTEGQAVLVNPTNIDKVYVPYDTIPGTTKAIYENYFKGAAPVSEAVKKQRMERAYGIYLTPGSTDAQIEAALGGATSVKGVK